MDYEYESWSPEPAPKKPRRWPWILLAIVAVLGVSVVLHLLNFPAIRLERGNNGFTLYMGQSAKDGAVSKLVPEDFAPVKSLQSPGHKVQIAPSNYSAPTPTSADGLSLQEIYETVLPSVVTITTETYGGSGLGTGILLSDDGYIITNAHVIENARSAQVLLHDDTVYEAALVGKDVASDLAVLKIDGTDLTPAQFGDSEMLRVGDTVVAIGNPLGTGLRGSMSDGIISGISRNVTINGRNMTLLQTNAALNSGNSGGPLINCYGQVVGICTAKLSKSYSSTSVEGLGFAIPMAAAKPIVDDLISLGYVSGRPALGITAEDVPLRAQIFYGLPAGAYVSSVTGSSPLQVGDIITAIGNTAVTDISSLTAARDQYTAGETVTVTVYRDGDYQEISVTMTEASSG